MLLASARAGAGKNGSPEVNIEHPFAAASRSTTEKICANPTNSAENLSAISTATIAQGKTQKSQEMTQDVKPPYAIETRGIKKSYGAHPVLKGIDLKILAGESLVVLGPNGAGKTTLIKTLATILKPSSGELFVNGISPKKDPGKIRYQLGVVTHDIFLYHNLTARENLDYYSRLFDIADSAIRILDVVEMVGMKARLNDRIGILSRGMQQRMSIARALLHQPTIMLMDEPDTGLDQQALSVLWGVIKGQGEQKRTVIATTHNLERAFELGDRFIMLCQGTVAAEVSKQGLSLASLARLYHESTRMTA